MKAMSLKTWYLANKPGCGFGRKSTITSRYRDYLKAEAKQNAAYDYTSLLNGIPYFNAINLTALNHYPACGPTHVDVPRKQSASHCK